MDGRLTWTDCDEAGDYVVPNVLSPRDLVFRPDNMDKTVPHTSEHKNVSSLKILFSTLFSLSLSFIAPLFMLLLYIFISVVICTVEIREFLSVFPLFN